MKASGIKQFLSKEDGSAVNQCLAVLTASIVLFSCGLHSGWPSPSLPKILSPEYPFEISNDDASYIAIIGPVGTVTGGITASIIVDIIGRKKTILAGVVPQIFAFGMIYFSYYGTELLYTARVFGGASEGAALAMIPMYIAEVTQPDIRGVLGSFVPLASLSGMLFMNILGTYLDIHTTALICAMFPVIFLCAFIKMPDTPYYLLVKNKQEKAEHALQFLRRKNNVQKELTILTYDVGRQMSESGRFKDLFTIESNYKAFLIVFATRIFQQYSGCTAFGMYSQILVKEATDIAPVLGASLILLTQLGGTVASSFLLDRMGRRPMFIISSGTCCTALLIQGIFFTLRDIVLIDLSSVMWLPLFAMIVWTFAFAMGLGVGMNILISEIYSTSIKAKAVGMGNIIFAASSISSIKFYQYTADNIGLAVPFYCFGIITFFATLFFYLPETRGKTLEQIQQELKGNKIVLKDEDEA